MNTRVVLDVSEYPEVVFGPKTPTWWATLGFMLVEGTIFGICVAAFFYLKRNSPDWPPAGTAPPDLLFGTINMVVLLLSLGIAYALQKAAKRKDLAACRRVLIVATIVGLVAVVLRALEYPALNVRWDSNAYGSIVWITISFHAFHLLTDLLETGGLTALAYSERMEEKFFTDFSDSGFYWYFVVLSWLPLYGMLYWVPRLI